MAGTLSLFSKVNSRQNIQQALLKASKPKILRAAQTGAEIGPRLIAAYAASALKPNQRKRSSPSLTDPSAYEGIVSQTPTGAILRLKPADHGEEFLAKFYAINNGAQAHPIFAINAPKLVFPGTKEWTGQIIKIDDVSHPGNRAYKFFQKGAKDTYQTILAALG